MLEHTFCHIPGVGPKCELRLWDAGVHTWEQACGCGALPLPTRISDRVRRHAEDSMARLAEDDTGYFYSLLPSREQWRMFATFRHRVAYLDIETTGLGSPDDYITAITLYDGSTLRHYVQGENLFDFAADIDRYHLLVTYNGKRFDIPFIRSYFGLPMRQAHIDLRYVLASLGYRGGLKGCERQLGLERDDLEDVDGFFAVLLWWDYHNNANPRALETLLAYNTLDVVNLQTLMVLAYNLKLATTPFLGTSQLPTPPLPSLPFRPDRETIARIKLEHGW
ncbi:MAG: ribonuclease H-like domain-containing protein [Candidatus Brocadiia bacterium]